MKYAESFEINMENYVEQISINENEDSHIHLMRE